MRKPARFTSGEPSELVVGGVHRRVAEPLVACLTAMEKAGSAVLTVPSETLMMMLLVVVPA